jgi:hypothetical protein
MTHRLWSFAGVVVLILAAVLATPAALASPDLQSSEPAPADVEAVEVEIGEGVPPGIPPRLLRQSFAAMKASAAGREYLTTPDGEAYAADVARTLRGQGTKSKPSYFASDDPGSDMCDDCGIDYDTWNDAADTDGEAGGADPWGYYGGCKNPYVVARHRNVFGHDLWRYYQQLGFCWEGGRITFVYRTRWPWVSTHWLNGWGFQGHISTNCYTETCEGHWIGADWARYWTQGKFEVCNLWRFGCRSRHPLIGIDINGWGGWYGWLIK